MSAQSIALHAFASPRGVTEVRPPAKSEEDKTLRRPRSRPYHRATQRELVRLALQLEGAYDDFHGDHAARGRRI